MRAGLSVHCEQAGKLPQRLKASRLDGTHDVELRRLVAVDLLIVDDFALELVVQDGSVSHYRNEIMRQPT